MSAFVEIHTHGDVVTVAAWRVGISVAIVTRESSIDVPEEPFSGPAHLRADARGRHHRAKIRIFAGALAAALRQSTQPLG